MAIDRNDSDERQARLDAMIAEFRAAGCTRLVVILNLARDMVVRRLLVTVSMRMISVSNCS